MSGPDPIVLTQAAVPLLNPSLDPAAAPVSFCDSLAAEPSSLFATPAPGFVDLDAANVEPFALFRPGVASVRHETLPDLLTAGSGELERLAREGYERDLQEQVGQLLRDFPACAVHNLSENYGRLPRFLQDVWVDYADDPGVGFRIDYLMENGRAVPRITFVRREANDRVIVLGSSPNSQGSRRGSTPALAWDDAAPVAAAGMLFTRTPGPLGSEPEGPGRPGSSLLRTNPVLGTAVTVGAGVLIYVAVDRQVMAMDMPQGVRSLVATGETALFYEGLGRLGFTERPQWGNVVRAAPHLALLQLGASHVFDELGLPRGSMGNNIASFAVSTGAYVGAPRLAMRFPRLANLYRLSIGLPAQGALTATAFRGSGLLAGGLRFAGAVGTVFLIDWLGGSLGEFFVWAGDGFSAPDATTHVWRTAVESLYADFANNAGGFAGWSARNLPSINKAAIGWARALSGSYDREFTGGVNDVIDRWVGGVNDVTEAIDNGLLLCALQSMEPTPEGGLRFDREAFQTHLRGMYRQESDVLSAAYRMESMLRPSHWGDRITEASEIADMISDSGYVRDQAELDSHLDALFHADHYTRRLRPMLETIVREERRAYEDRLGALGLLDASRPRSTRELNGAQRDFLYGDGRTSEAAIRSRRIEIFNALLTRLNSGSNLWEATGVMAPYHAAFDASH